MNTRHLQSVSAQLCLFGALLFAVAGQRGFAASTPDLSSLNGLWQPVTGELAGKPIPEAVLKTITLKLDKEKYEVTVAGEPGSDSGTYTLDPDSGPKAIKINGIKGPNAGKVLRAIYELKGDTLRVCYDLSGAKAPEEFKTIAGTRLYLVTYHRKAVHASETQDTQQAH